MASKAGENRMTWKALVRLPDDAGTTIEQMATRRGVAPAVMIRMIVLEYLEQRERGGRPE